MYSQPAIAMSLTKVYRSQHGSLKAIDSLTLSVPSGHLRVAARAMTYAVGWRD